MQQFGKLLFALCLLLTPGVMCPVSAEPQQVRGTQFVTIMNRNTLVAKNRDGIEFRAFFLAGGVATYTDEAGLTDSGNWRVKGDEVCVQWPNINDGKEMCARVYSDANGLIWKGEGISGEGKLLGSVQ